MKKALKILIPILMALVLIGSIIWYLMIYDPAFTRDFLLQQARNCESRGNHNAAAWFYNLAYEQSQGNEDVAIELADQFKSIGNYTKAEFTLSNAIADNPSAKLYTALCRTYVEQDKLLDAVTMLENVANPEIKAELERQRPAAPTTKPEPGFYNYYIQVSLDSDSGTLYYSTDGTYPTTQSNPYAEPFTLPAGETTIYAIAVGSNGLVSPLTVFGYTIGGVVEPVEFTDAAIEAKVREILGIPTDTIYTNDLWDLTSFEMPAEAAAYDDLKYLSRLKELTIREAKASLEPLSYLTALEKLDLSGSRPTSEDLGVIGDLLTLQELNLADCGLSTIARLGKLVNLTSLNLDNNTIRNIQIIAGMSGLKTLKMSRNALNDLSNLSSLSSLSYLDVSYNALTSLSPLRTCTNLTVLIASNNSLTDITPLETLNNLTELNVSNNQIADITVLAGLTAMKKLNLSTTALTYITCLSALIGMTDLDFSYNAVTALPVLPQDCALININGAYNQLTSIDELKDFWYLNHVNMDYNLLTSIDALAECPALVRVDVYGNAITDVSALTAHSIVVNYTPITE